MPPPGDNQIIDSIRLVGLLFIDCAMAAGHNFEEAQLPKLTRGNLPAAMNWQRTEAKFSKRYAAMVRSSAGLSAPGAGSSASGAGAPAPLGVTSKARPGAGLSAPGAGLSASGAGAPAPSTPYNSATMELVEAYRQERFRLHVASVGHRFLDKFNIEELTDEGRAKLRQVVNRRPSPQLFKEALEAAGLEYDLVFSCLGFKDPAVKRTNHVGLNYVIQSQLVEDNPGDIQEILQIIKRRLLERLREAGAGSSALPREPIDFHVLFWCARTQLPLLWLRQRLLRLLKLRQRT